MFHIVLVEPEIPQNTGNIGRLAVSTGSTLHLIKPLGFSLEETKVRRAGLDYWPYLDLHVHESWESFLREQNVRNLIFLSARGNKSIYEHSFFDKEYIVFGNETKGFPSHFYDDFKDVLYTLPMPGENARSLNLANAVSTVVYEGLRQVKGWGTGEKVNPPGGGK